MLLNKVNILNKNLTKVKQKKGKQKAYIFKLKLT